MFTGPKGAAIRRGNFNKLTKWKATVAKIGATGLHLHDLRHTGNVIAAASKTSTRDLMARMGHDSMNAAIIYQHATRDADRAIAAAMNEQLRPSFGGDDQADDDPEDGAAGALVPTG